LLPCLPSLDTVAHPILIVVTLMLCMNSLTIVTYKTNEITSRFQRIQFHYSKNNYKNHKDRERGKHTATCDLIMIVFISNGRGSTNWIRNINLYPVPATMITGDRLHAKHYQHQGGIKDFTLWEPTELPKYFAWDSVICGQ
jgi:hypothetical protein